MILAVRRGSRDKREFGRRGLKGAGLRGWGLRRGGFCGELRRGVTGLSFLLIPVHCSIPFCLPTIGLPGVKMMLPLVWIRKNFQRLPLQVSQGHPQGRAVVATRGQRG